MRKRTDNGTGSANPSGNASGNANGNGSHARILRPPRTNRRLKRLKPGATLGDVARGTGLNVEHVSRIFNGKRMPRLKTAARIAAHLEITIDQLYRSLTA